MLGVGLILLMLAEVFHTLLYPHGSGPVGRALYISLVTLSTFRFGEIVAAHPLLRLVAAFQAVTGFGLLTATVSWILQTYPALNRRRALAHHLNLFREAAGPEGVSSLDPRHAAGLLESL